MLKVVVFDSGFGGEIFADRLEEEINVINIIRVIDWRHAEIYQTNPKMARDFALEAIRPYIGRVDLIIFANHLLSLTSLKYFQKKFPGQNFLGLKLKAPDTFIKRDTLVLTTKAAARTMAYRGFIFNLKKQRKVKSLMLDSWLDKIDDGELTQAEIDEALINFVNRKQIKPGEIVLASSNFEDIVPNLTKLFGRKARVYSSFNDAIREACKILRIRGSVRKLK